MSMSTASTQNFQLLIRMTRGDEFHVEANLDQTVQDVKGNILKTKVEYTQNQLRLIFNGNVLNDDQRLGDFIGEINEKTFLVLFPKKNTKMKVIDSNETPINPSINPSPTKDVLDILDDSKEVPKEVPKEVNPNYNLDVLDEVPKEPTFEPFLIPGEVVNADNSEVDRIENMATNPMIAALMQQVAQVQPELFQQMQQDPSKIQDFLQYIMNSGMMDGEDIQDVYNEDEEMIDSIIPGIAEMQADLTDDDKSAIKRLTDLGFEESQATEAYILCDKKEELAANYLFG